MRTNIVLDDKLLGEAFSVSDARTKKELIHEGDMFGIVSTGPSSIAIDLTYDIRRLDEAIKKISGAGLKPTDIVQGGSTSEGPSEVRYRAHVAFSTAYDTRLTGENEASSTMRPMAFVGSSPKRRRLPGT